MIIRIRGAIPFPEIPIELCNLIRYFEWFSYIEDRRAKISWRNIHRDINLIKHFKTITPGLLRYLNWHAKKKTVRNTIPRSSN